MTSSEEELYQDHILAHYEDPYHRGRCSRCTHVHADSNPLCGDKIRIELHVDDHGQMREIFFDGEGCCISQAAASMLVERFDGKSIDEVKQFSAQDMMAMFGVRLTPNRQKCALLSWKVLQAAIYSPVEAAQRIAQCDRMELQRSDAAELHQLSAPGSPPGDVLGSASGPPPNARPPGTELPPSNQTTETPAPSASHGNPSASHGTPSASHGKERR